MGAKRKLKEGQNDALIQHTASGGNQSPILEFTPYEKNPSVLAQELYDIMKHSNQSPIFAYHEWWDYLINSGGFDEEKAKEIVKDAWKQRGVQNDNHHKQLVAKIVARAQKEIKMESKHIKMSDLLNEHILGDLPSEKMPKMRMNPMTEQLSGQDEWKVNIDKMKDDPGSGYAEVTVPVGSQQYLRGLDTARREAIKDLSKKMNAEITEDGVMVYLTNSVMSGTNQQILTVVVKPIGTEQQ